MTLRIAFIAHTKDPQRFLQDPAFIYRCENPALVLQAQGHHVDLLHYTQFPSVIHNLVRRQKRYDLVVFHRPRWRFGFATLVNALRRQGSVCVADFDDLVFDTDYVAVSPGVVNQLVSPEQTKINFLRHQRALLCFNQPQCAITVSTTPLVDKVQALMAKHQQPKANVSLAFNSVHWHWRQVEKDVSRATPSNRPLLTYFPGTRSHDRDFALIIPALAEILAAEPEWQLQITGVLHDETKQSLLHQMQTTNANLAQVQFTPKQPFAQYRQHVARSWVNLAPLESNEFNRHKSALKAIEASFFGAITVATAIPDMLRLTDSGALLVPDQNDVTSEVWSSAIRAAMLNAPQADLRQHNLNHYKVEQHAQQLLTIAAQGHSA